MALANMIEAMERSNSPEPAPAAPPTTPTSPPPVAMDWWGRAALIVARELSDDVAEGLARRGCAVIWVETIEEAVERMEATRFDVVLIPQGLDEIDDGLRFVNTVKSCRALPGSRASSLSCRFASVPFFLWPVCGQTGRAVVLGAAGEMWLEEVKSGDLASAILQAESFGRERAD